MDRARILQCPYQPGSPGCFIDSARHYPAISVRPATAGPALGSSERATRIDQRPDAATSAASPADPDSHACACLQCPIRFASGVFACVLLVGPLFCIPTHPPPP